GPDAQALLRLGGRGRRDRMPADPGAHDYPRSLLDQHPEGGLPSPTREVRAELFQDPWARPGSADATRMDRSTLAAPYRTCATPRRPAPAASPPMRASHPAALGRAAPGFEPAPGAEPLHDGGHHPAHG